MPCDDSCWPGAIKHNALHDILELEHLHQTAKKRKMVIKNMQGELKAATDTMDKL